VLPLLDQVVFPAQSVTLFVTREAAIRLLERAAETGRPLVAVTQATPGEEPAADDLAAIGSLVRVRQAVRLPDGSLKAVLEGEGRARLVGLARTGDGFATGVEALGERPARSAEIEALMRSVVAEFERYARLNPKVPAEAAAAVGRVEEAGRFADAVAGAMSLKVADKQRLLETLDPTQRLLTLAQLLDAEIEILELERKIQGRVRKQMERTQREYYLTEQLKAIQRELGKKEEGKAEVEELRARLQAARLPAEAAEKAGRELARLEAMSPLSAEATVVRTYLDWLITVPWQARTKESLDLDAAARILDEDHAGLERPKERIIEYLAVRRLVRKPQGPILCLVGPPGVGKTSLAKSIARVTRRRFVRVSLGGVRDEAEIRGHRRTYVGALPGQIIQGMRKAKTKNPVFLLDEVDKMSSDFRGDPAAALLEVLDPEQNRTFVDHYLDVEYDLSEVLFVTTANTTHGIPPALLDRMEVLRLPGYTDAEKIRIATGFLIPKQRRAHGLTAQNLSFTPGAVRALIREYTREAGVRTFEKEVAAVCRKVAQAVIRHGRRTEARVTASRLAKYLGPPRFRDEPIEREDAVGVASGLAWTEAGGEVLTIEVTVLDGKGRIELTGKLGEVMRESAHAALSFVRSRAAALGLRRDFYKRADLHIHVPEGAIPKDGPSAGIAIATALASALTRRPVRRGLAMTGEITLRGRILPVGGIKEKVLAAHRAQLGTILLPAGNAKDLREIPAAVRRGVDIVLVDGMEAVLAKALHPSPGPAAEPAGAREQAEAAPALAEAPAAGA
jgi:ATP-dependent Lon protease